MRNVVLGFLAGVILTGLALMLVPEQESPVVESVPGDAPHADAQTPANMVRRTPSPAATDNTHTDPENVLTAPVEEALLTLDELQRRKDEARRVYDAAEREFRRAERVERWANEPPPALPIVLPPEFDYLSDDPSDNHEQIQREAIDPVWAASTETQIHNYFAGRPEVTSKYGYPRVECRTTRCEIAFVTRGVGAAQDFRGLNGQFFAQAWADQFTVRGFAGLNLSVRNQGDVTTILWHLTQPSEQLSAIGRTDGASR